MQYILMPRDAYNACQLGASEARFLLGGMWLYNVIFGDGVVVFSTHLSGGH